MPEYSSTTITPADGVQVPSMNGSTSGNFLLSALRDYILASKGQANGLASLGSDGKLTASQLPDLADDVIVVASYAVLPATGTAGKIYITADNNKMYRWDSDLSTPDYVELSVDLSEYAKLTDLAAEETAREAADTDLNNAITAIDHRLDNLEQPKGGYVVSNYKDGAITPSGKGAWSIVEGLRGVSRVENNLTQNGNFADDSVWRTVNTSLTVQDNVGKVTLSDVTGSIWQYHYLISGHEYLFVCDIQASNSTMQLRISNAFGGSDVYAQKNTSWQTLVGKWTCNTTQNSQYPRIYANDASVGDYFNVRKVFCRDLNVYFGGTIPSDADTIAEIQTNYPHLLLPSDYGVRIVDSSYSGVRAYSANILEPMTQTTPNGTYSDGTYTNNTRLGDSAWAGKIDVSDIGQVTIAYDSCNGEFRYGLSNNDVSGSGNIVAECGTNIGSASVTVNTSGFKFLYMYFRAYTNGTTATLAKVRVNVGDTALAYSAYHAPSTLSLTFQGKSAGSVYEEYFPETGEMTKPLKTVFLKNLSYQESVNGTNGYEVFSEITDAKGSTMNLISNKLLPASAWEDIARYSVRVGYTQRICITVPKTVASSVAGVVQWLTDNDVTLTYELATPDPSTFVTPILDNTLLTESGGRMATVQTGTVVDGSFDLGFITL